MAMPAHQLDIFYDDLAYKPYCAEYLDRGLDILPKRDAIKRRYIQGNQPCMVNYFFFDLDHDDSVLAWHIENLPVPYWTARNPQNGHCHICYKLETPFATSEIASIKPIRYAAAIQSAYAKKLGSDTSYSRLITKNPLHKHWDVVFWSNEAYSLDYLADFVDLNNKPTPEERIQGLGRNCTIFDVVRYWGYRKIREFLSNGTTYDVWYNTVLACVIKENQNFPEPLQYRELAQIAKSISNWIWKRFSLEDFSEIQAKRGAKGGQKSKGGGRPSLGEPWKEMGISRATYFRRKKSEI
ncbi:Replicase family protein [compost metagenome]|jgi:hypothetical protein